MAGLNEFVNVTSEMIGAVLEPLGFTRVDLPDCREITYSKKVTFEGAPTIVRVYTGILKETGQSRPSGKDAIRVCLGRAITEPGPGGKDATRVRIFKTMPTVRRIGTWNIHLLDRITSIGDGLANVPENQLSELDLLEGRTAPPRIPSGQELDCPTCGAPMVGPKPSRRGPFYGCSRFPVCRGARNLSDVQAEQAEQPAGCDQHPE